MGVSSNSQLMRTSRIAKDVPFCNCGTNDRVNNANHTTNRTFVPSDACRCGEDASKKLEWTWDTVAKQPQTLFYEEVVSFHPCYSQGTSVVRGERALQRGMVHYWEVKVVHWLSGTDLVNTFTLFVIFSAL